VFDNACNDDHDMHCFRALERGRHDFQKPKIRSVQVPRIVALVLGWGEDSTVCAPGFCC